MKKITLIILLLFFCRLSLFAQKESYVWKFGWYAGLDFNKGYAIADTVSSMFAPVGCASISDKNGNLLFYTNGWTVWNKNHQIMSGGANIAPTVPPAFHDVCLIIPLPGSQTLYYIFSGGYQGSSPTELKYSMVDINQNSGLGQVINPNMLLLSDVACKLTAVLHSDGQSVWIITHKWNSSSFYSYLITNTGISAPVISNIGSYVGSTTLLYEKTGYLRVSPRGDKLASAIMSDIVGTPNGRSVNLEIFNFDKTTGIISNPISFSVKYPWGVEFSPDGSKLYFSSISSNGQICQLNIDLNTTSAIINSLTVISSSGFVGGAGLQIAPDGKIYVSKRDSFYLGIINNPDKAGISCNYIGSGIYLGGRKTTDGLPVFIQTNFYKPYFEVKNKCFGDTTYFSILDTIQQDSVKWTFGDIFSGQLNYSVLLKPYHIFTDTGEFNVQLICFRDTIIDTIVQKIRIGFYPNAYFIIPDTVQCLNGNNFVFNNFSSICCGALTYKWEFGDSTNSYIAFPVHTYLSGDSFQVKLTALSNYGCEDTFSKKVYLLQSPSSVFSVNNPSQCFDSNKFIFTNYSHIAAGSLSYLWNFGDSNASVQNNAVHHYTSVDTFNVSLIAVSNLGCSDSVTRQVYIHSKPVVDFTTLDSIQCLNGNNFTFINKSTIDAGGINCLWNFGDSGISNICNSFHIYKHSDTLTVKLVVSSDYGCKDSASKIIVVKPKPDANIYVNDSSQCLSFNLFKFQVQNQSMIIDTIKWDFGDGKTDTSITPNHTYSNQGSFIVKLYETAINGCRDTSIKTIIVNPQPKAAFSVNDTSQCLFGNSFNFQNLTSGILQKTLWEFGDGNYDTSTNTSHKYSVEDTFKVSLVSTNQDGCKDSIIKQIIINQRPNISFIINDSSQCLSGNSFNYSNTTTGKNNFQWGFGDGQSDTSKTTTHSYSSAGNYKVILHTTNKEGCTDSISKAIIVFKQPKAGFTVNDSIQCINSNHFQFSNNTTGTNKYLWDFGDSKTDTNNNSSHTYSSTGTFKIKLFAISLDKCSDSIIKQLNILPKPISGFGVNDSIQCLKSNKFRFNNSTTGASSYKWDFGDGNSDTIINPDHSYLISGNYNTRLISQSSGGCRDTSNLTITVLEDPTAAFCVNDTSQILPGNNFVFSNLTNCKPASSTCKYLWDFGDGQSDTISNPTHNYKAIGMYHVLLTATSTNGCKDTISLNVYVTNIIVITAFTVKDVCLGDLAYFKNSSTIQYDSFMNFLWDFGDGNTIIRPNPQHMYTDTGIYKVQLVSLSYGGFRDTANGKIKVLPSPIVKIIASPDSILEQGIKATLTANGSFDSLLWSTGAITASIIVEKSGIYSIRVVDFNGCDAVDSITIEYLPEKPFSAMNVITPNGDGINDYWKIDNIEKYQPCELAIYNRWGDELYSTNDYNNNWDGKYKGKNLPEGTYYFVLKTKAGMVYKGAINVLK